MLGQREREQIAVPSRQLPCLAERRRFLTLAAAAPAGEPDLEHEQLFECEPPAAELGLVRGARDVQHGEGVGAQGHVVSDSGRDRIGKVTRLGSARPMTSRASDGHLVAG